MITISFTADTALTSHFGYSVWLGLSISRKIFWNYQTLSGALFTPLMPSALDKIGGHVFGSTYLCSANRIQDQV